MSITLSGSANKIGNTVCNAMILFIASCDVSKADKSI